MDQTTAGSSVRKESSSTQKLRATSKSSNQKQEPQAPAPQQEAPDYGVTVKGRFDPDLRRFFVTILDTSSQTLIAQFPSQAAARYAQQIAKSRLEGESSVESTAETGKQESQSNRTVGNYGSLA